jgi:heavy metal efflux system protein
MINKRIIIFCCFISFVYNGYPQSPLILNLDVALEMAALNHHSVLIGEAQVRLEAENRQMTLPPLNISAQRGQLFTAERDYNLEIFQGFGTINTWSARRNIGIKTLEQQQLKLDLTFNQLEMQVKQTWYRWQFLNELYNHKYQLLLFQIENERIAELQNKEGEIGMVELINIRINTAGAERELHDISSEMDKEIRNLKYLISYSDEIQIRASPLAMYTIDFRSDGTKDFSGDNLHSGYFGLQAEIAELNIMLGRSKRLPEISAGYFQRSIGGLTGFRGWQVSLGIPLWFLPGNNEVVKSRILSEIATHEFENKKKEQNMIIEELIFSLDRLYEKIHFYNQEGLDYADMLEREVMLKSEDSDIKFDVVLMSMINVTAIRTGYLETINEYNQTAIQLEYYVK